MTAARDQSALDDEEIETWAALATVLAWLPDELDGQLERDGGLTHFEYGVLFALARAPERTLRMSVLAGYANSSLSRLSRAVARLERHGWVRRRTDPSDGRFTLATLTAEGARVHASVSPGHAATVRRLVLDPLTRAQRRQLQEIGRRIALAIRGDEGWRPPRSR